MQLSTTLLGVSFDYNYPRGLDFSPGSDLHKKLLTDILDCTRQSWGVVSARHDSWHEIDKVLDVYKDLSDEEEEIKDKDIRIPVSIVYPHSRAVLETTLGYLSGAFFDSPIFRFEGLSPEDTIGAILLEKVVQYQMNKSKNEAALYCMLRDSLAYGSGFLSNDWVKVIGYITDRRGGGKRRRKITKFEGNKFTVLDPYLVIPDHSVPTEDIQSGSHFSWITSENLYNLITEEATNDLYFNIKYLKAFIDKGYSFICPFSYPSKNNARGKRSNVFGNVGTQSGGIASDVSILWHCRTLIPSQYNLSNSDLPEKWIFGVAGSGLIIAAHKLEYDHEKYPVVSCVPEMDGHTVLPISRLEIIYGLQHLLDWLLNTHIQNIRRAVNDTFVVDANRIVWKDLIDNQRKGGGIIRLKKNLAGNDVRKVVAQLPVQDVTRGHVEDSLLVSSWIQNLSGADDAAMGVLRKSGPERLTSAEFQGTRAGLFSRLERIARLISVSTFKDLGEMVGSNTLQFMEDDVYIKITGEWAQTLMDEYGKSKGSKHKISPFDLSPYFDVVPKSGTIPGSNFSEVWLKMFELIGTNQELMERFDIGRIGQHILRANGAKNVEDFRRMNINIKTVSDEEAMDQVKKGNLVPV